MTSEHIYGGTVGVAAVIAIYMLIWACIRHDTKRSVWFQLITAFWLMVYIGFWMGSR